MLGQKLYINYQVPLLQQNPHPGCQVFINWRVVPLVGPSIVTAQLQGSIAAGERNGWCHGMAKRNRLVSSGEVSLEMPRNRVPPFFPLPTPEDPAGPGVGNKFREISLMTVTYTVSSSHRIPRNQDRPFKSKLREICPRVFLSGCENIAFYINVSESH